MHSISCNCKWKFRLNSDISQQTCNLEFPPVRCIYGSCVRIATQATFTKQQITPQLMLLFQKTPMVLQRWLCVVPVHQLNFRVTLAQPTLLRRLPGLLSLSRSSTLTQIKHCLDCASQLAFWFPAEVGGCSLTLNLILVFLSWKESIG